MADDANRRINDPARIRALAHPTRLALLDHLGEVEEATATECAAIVGESPSSCSFHLRMLEKYGFVERLPQRGRERPWRATQTSWNATPDPEIEGSTLAGAALADLVVQRETERIRAWLAAAGAAPPAPEWIEAMTVTKAEYWASAEELAEVREQIHALAERFRGRREDPSLRPAGARKATLFAVQLPDLADEAPAPGGTGESSV
ncbi:helix-turn-helix domain-containing protein [Agromyces seonyuensis]|uniref:Helix-turn-helix domain-containing protein n=1 Tax=Agromyces seonyuensis TaxID=2662446 RepID=A0A6I4P0A0_9MICO|nr:helix-turn-helix domain-containing protein [Agromyces seonyuensis]MWC00054.1 helix-turn-helix domain-containing protein [Agromyces seonyuensis]